ncbi:MAG TPA: UDP-3-O-acyl-N-acetylglucosamine deacetylase [Gemmatimonadales bacterium]|nr:UDP-3-O-acyl-N-acetylglucosamine deacetylase [Gemmatimonadales bacterium]
MPRRTLAGPASFEGPALHTGGVTHLVARPGAPGQGIRFRRTDLPGSPEVAAELAAVEATERRTALGAAPATIHTVEHVLAALNALELDDLTLELDGPEPPILDGSFGPFVEGFVRAGIREHPGGVTTFRLRAPVEVQAGDASYRAEPHPGLRLSVTLAFDHPAIGVQRGTWDVTPDGFRRELAAARTFGLLREVEALRARGLALGASHANAIALDDHGVVGTTLRWPDEFVRHKAGDLVGDLALLGGRLHAHVRADRPSHHGNVALARALAAAAVKEIVT